MAVDPHAEAAYAFGMREIGRRCAPEMDREINERELIEHVTGMLTGEASVVHPSDYDPDLQPLYRYDADSQDWKFEPSGYTQFAALAWVDHELRACTKSLSYFATTYACTQNEYLDVDVGLPPSAEVIPKYPFILAVMDILNDPRDTIIEKSRDMMASWMAMTTALHDVMFRKNWPVMAVSRIERLVDDGGEKSTIDSLHGKMRYIHYRLPTFLREGIPLMFKYLQVLNPLTSSHCTGFSSTPHAGRGPKWKRAILDEFAWVEHSEQVMTAVTRACPRGKLMLSTPFGKSNAFYRIRAKSSRGVWPEVTTKDATKHWLRITLHWTHHPERDQAWYDHEVATGSMTAEAVAQELDISYDKSVVGRVYPKFSYEIHTAGGALAKVAERILYQPNRPLVVCMDWNVDPLVWIIVQPYAEAPQYRVIGQVVRRNATWEDAVAEFACRFCSKDKVASLVEVDDTYLDRYGRNGVCVAGPDGHRVDVLIHGDATEEKSTVYSRVKMYGMLVQAMSNLGFRVKVRVPAANPPRRERIEVVNDCLAKNDIAVDPSAEELIKDFEGGIWDKPGLDMDQKTMDEDGLTRSHASSAFGYYIHRMHKVSSSIHRPAKTVKNQDISKMINRWGAVAPR